MNTFIGTGNGAPDAGLGNAAGDTLPGAAYPFGMLLWSPDTTTQAGGYRYQDNTIYGFSVTHFSGRGISCWQDLPFLPTTQPVADSPGTHWASYSSTFSHSQEEASPGSYEVTLDNGVRVQLTVTQRSGFARFTFPPGNTGTLLLNAGGSANGNTGDTWIGIGNSRQVFGWLTSGNCGGDFQYKIHFTVEFDRDIAGSGTWNGDSLSPNSTYAKGSQSGAFLTFDTSGNSVVQAKVGLSFVHTGNAQLNLWTENPGWDFDAVQRQAQAAWNQRLHKIDRLQGGTADELAVFYTALYHTLIHPSTFSDVNGQYLGFDGKLHHTAATQYHNVPTWDFWRTEVPLLALIAPDVASDLAQSLVNDAQQDPGGGLPRWVHANTNSCGMFGDGPPVVIATAYAFGARDFDTPGALAAMLRNVNDPSTTSAGCPVREAAAEYLQYGYVPHIMWGSAARTLEYAISDFATAQFARNLGDKDTYRSLIHRAQNWRHLWSNGFLIPRNPDGSFVSDFDPDSCADGGFIEGSGGQYLWLLPFNIRGLFDAMGGNTNVIARLDRHFSKLNEGPCSEFAFLGNEPELKTPWLYAWAGVPWKTRALVRRALAQLYGNTPNGMPGNDDGGVLSAWVVFSGLGIFPEIPAVGGFVVGTPLFSNMVLHLSGGDVAIHAPGAAADTPYVQRVQFNGQDYRSPWISWDALAQGGQLEFVLAAAPAGWSGPPDPPSFDDPGPP